MRSRPKVTLLLHPGKVVPGEDLIAEVVLKSRSKTPVDFVNLHLQGERFSTLESVPWREILYIYNWRSDPLALEEGEQRLRAKFPIPPNLPPSYDGGGVKCIYTLHIHVAIPWWTDRHETFFVPIVPPPVPVPEGRSGIFTVGEAPSMELSLDTQTIVAGEKLNGSVSIQKMGGRKIRGIELAFVETETLAGTIIKRHEARRYRLRVFDGTPADGQSIPFRVRVPVQCMPSFVHGPFELRTYLHARALVAWGDDIILRTRITVYPSSSDPPDTRGSVAPVGNERQLKVWHAIATKYGALVDASEKRIQARRGAVAIEIRAEQRGTNPWLVAELGWPHLGLELSIGERKWSDLLANSILTGAPAIDDRLAAHARELHQAKPIVTSDVLHHMLGFEAIEVDDDGARLGSPEPRAEELERFLSTALDAASAFDEAIQKIPPPALFAADVAAWETFAARLGGRLERGRMWITEGHIGPDAVTLGSMWSRTGLLLGTTIEVAIAPSLEALPLAPDDPSIPPAARDTWRELISRAKGVRVELSAIKLELEGKVADPLTAMPIVDLAINLRRALGRVRAAGPFR